MRSTTRRQLRRPSVKLSLMAAFVDRLLDTKNLAHAYILTGSQASGLAQHFIHKLFCEDQCNACGQCQKLESGNHPDVRWVAPEGKNIKIEQIRGLQHTALYPPSEANFKIFVIEKAETLSREAANSLLKILESPPTYLVFLLLTQRLGDLLPTVVSRCRVVQTGLHELSEDIEQACWGNPAWMQTFDIETDGDFQLTNENLVESFGQTHLLTLYQATQKVFQLTSTLSLSQVLKMSTALSKMERPQLEYLLQGLAYLAHQMYSASPAGLHAVRKLELSYGALRSNANVPLLLESCFLRLWRLSHAS